jgi:hypothetical protein
VSASDQARRVAVAVLASICLTAGCTSRPSIDGGSPAAAAAESSGATAVGESSAPSTPNAPPVPPSPVPSTSPALPTVDEVLTEERFVPLAVALDRSGLDEIIDGLDDVILLAPTGTAFASAGSDIGIDFSTLMNNPRLLEAVIRYHVVADTSARDSWRTLNGAFLDVNSPYAATVDGIEVLERIPVRNGVVLVMPRLLLPGSQPVGAGQVQSVD